jgi:hypothetical protein
MLLIVPILSTTTKASFFILAMLLIRYELRDSLSLHRCYGQKESSSTIARVIPNFLLPNYLGQTN